MIMKMKDTRKLLIITTKQLTTLMIILKIERFIYVAILTTISAKNATLN